MCSPWPRLGSGALLGSGAEPPSMSLSARMAAGNAESCFSASTLCDSPPRVFPTGEAWEPPFTMRKERLLRFHAELKSQITSKTSQVKTQVKSSQVKLKSMELRYTCPPPLGNPPARGFGIWGQTLTLLMRPFSAPFKKIVSSTAPATALTTVCNDLLC